MKVVSSEIEAYYDITVQFRIDNVRGYIEHGDAQDQSPEHQRSQDFGPGWHFEWFRMKVDDNTNQPEGACQWALAIYLYTGSCGYPEPVTWSLEAKPLKGDRRYMKMNMVVTNTFTDGDGWGWPTFVSKSKWDSYTTLQEDNAVRITAKVRARMAPTPSLDKCLNIAHKFVTSENRLSDICFMANSTRKGVGQTSKPQKLFVDRGVIWRNCPPLLSRKSHHTSPLTENQTMSIVAQTATTRTRFEGLCLDCLTVRVLVMWALAHLRGTTTMSSMPMLTLTSRMKRRSRSQRTSIRSRRVQTT